METAFVFAGRGKRGARSLSEKLPIELFSFVQSDKNGAKQVKSVQNVLTKYRSSFIISIQNLK